MNKDVLEGVKCGSAHELPGPRLFAMASKSTWQGGSYMSVTRQLLGRHASRSTCSARASSTWCRVSYMSVTFQSHVDNEESTCAHTSEAGGCTGKEKKEV